ncbi:hypothetical protein ACWCPD_25800 [Streptomyces sp. NPDC001935]
MRRRPVAGLTIEDMGQDIGPPCPGDGHDDMVILVLRKPGYP